MRLRAFQERAAAPSFTMIDMTITEQTNTTNITATLPQEAFELVAFDLYRDIHKGIRAELFALTSTAGSLDPADACGRADLTAHIASVGGVLTLHAEHEDDVIEPALREHAAFVAERISTDHVLLEATFDRIGDIAQSFATAPQCALRRLGHQLYLELTGFTSSYLAHQLIEERVVMPTLERAVGVDAVIGMHMAIVGSIPPEQMGQSLAFMLPAMNVDDRTELLGGMRMSAPAEAFAGVVSLARSVLLPADFAALAARLQLD
jgi:hypothetical protein